MQTGKLQSKTEDISGSLFYLWFVLHSYVLHPLPIIREFHLSFPTFLKMILSLALSPYNSNLILHLNKPLKKLFYLFHFFKLLLLLSLQIFTSIEGVSFQKQNNKKRKIQQLKVKTSVAGRGAIHRL